jgi:hypothetical protein
MIFELLDFSTNNRSLPQRPKTPSLLQTVNYSMRRHKNILVRTTERLPQPKAILRRDHRELSKLLFGLPDKFSQLTSFQETLFKATQVDSEINRGRYKRQYVPSEICEERKNKSSSKQKIRFRTKGFGRRIISGLPENYETKIEKISGWNV